MATPSLSKDGNIMATQYSPFFGIASELRDKIYCFVLIEPLGLEAVSAKYAEDVRKERCLQPASQNISASEVLDTQVLRVKEQIFIEARAILY
jgi:hypothetical protein